MGANIKAPHLPCVLKVPRPSLRGRGILAEGGVQVVGDLVEVTLRLFHLFHVLSQEDCQVFRNALVRLVQKNVLETSPLPPPPLAPPLLGARVVDDRVCF